MLYVYSVGFRGIGRACVKNTMTNFFSRNVFKKIDDCAGYDSILFSLELFAKKICDTSFSNVE